MNRVYGDYRSFSVKPSEKAICKALMHLGKRMASYLKRKGLKPRDFTFEHIVKESGLNPLIPVWTVATKAIKKVK